MCDSDFDFSFENLLSQPDFPEPVYSNESSESCDFTDESFDPPQKNQMSPPLDQFIGSQPEIQSGLINASSPLAISEPQTTNISPRSNMNYNDATSSIPAINATTSGPPSFFQSCHVINTQQSRFPVVDVNRKPTNRAKHGSGPEVFKLKTRNPEYNDTRNYRETEVFKKFRNPTKDFFTELGVKYNQVYNLQIMEGSMKKFGRDQKRNLKCAVLFFQNQISHIAPFLIQNGFRD